jgi:hypothetical protein
VRVLQGCFSRRDELEHLLIRLAHGVAPGGGTAERERNSGEVLAIPRIGLNAANGPQGKRDGSTGFVEREIDEVCHVGREVISKEWC